MTRRGKLRVASALAVATTLLAGTAPAQAAISIGPKATYLVRISPAARTVIETAIKSLGGSVDARYQYAFDGFKVTLPVAAATALARVQNVASVEPDLPVELSADTGQSAPPSWGLDRIDQREVLSRAAGYTGRYGYRSAGAGSTVYVVDTGVAPHDDFGARLSSSGFSALSDGVGVRDCNGHGTHVASTAVGTAFGVAKAAKVVPVRVLDCTGAGSISGVIAGLDWILSPLNPNPKARAVVNMSLGGGISSSLDSAVLRVTNAGIPVVVAAGNKGADACQSSPARVPSALTVGATDSIDARASYSNGGPCVDLSAPGSSITGAWFDSPSSTRVLSGTSMASPHVAGAVAVAWGLQPTATVETISQLVVQEATVGAIVGLSAGTPNRLLYVSPTDGAPPVVPPTVGLDTVSEITHAAATVSLRVRAGGAPTSVRLDVGTDATLSGAVRTVDAGTVTGTDEVTLPVRIDGLAAATTVRFRATAVNESGTTTTVIGSFATLPPPVVAPTVEAGSVTDLTAYSANLAGTVRAGNASATVSFQYSTDPDFAVDAKTVAAVPSSVSGNTATAVSLPITFLDGGQRYHYRLVATNPTATVLSAIGTFTTPVAPGRAPVATIDPVRGARAALTRVTGTVDPQGQTTTVRIVHGPSSSLRTDVTTTVIPSSPITGMGAVPVEAVLSGLTPGRGVYFAIEAVNAAGVTRSAVQYAIVSPERPEVKRSYGNSQTGSSVRLNAVANAQGSNTRWSFRYGTDPTLTTGTTLVAATPNAITDALDRTVTATPTGLPASTRIWFRVEATVLTGPAIGETILGPIESVETLNVASTTTAPTTTTARTTVPSTTTTVPSGPGALPQQITFAPIADREFGPGVALGATASSGLPVTYSVTTPQVCQILRPGPGYVVQFAAGLGDVETATCTVIASQGGSALHAAAEPVARSFTWRKAATSIWTGTIPTIRVGRTGDLWGYWGTADRTLMSGLYSLNAALRATSLTPDTCSIASTVLMSTTKPYTRVRIDGVGRGTCVVRLTVPGDSSRRLPSSASVVLTVA